MQCPKRPEEAVGFLETRVTDVCEPPWGCWKFKFNLSPLEELLPNEPSLQPNKMWF